MKKKKGFVNFIVQGLQKHFHLSVRCLPYWANWTNNNNHKDLYFEMDLLGPQMHCSVYIENS